MIILLLKPENSENIIPQNALFIVSFFLFCVDGTHSFMAIVARYFMSADFRSHDICLTSVTIQICGPVHRV